MRLSFCFIVLYFVLYSCLGSLKTGRLHESLKKAANSGGDSGEQMNRKTFAAKSESTDTPKMPKFGKFGNFDLFKGKSKDKFKNEKAKKESVFKSFNKNMKNNFFGFKGFNNWKSKFGSKSGKKEL